MLTQYFQTISGTQLTHACLSSLIIALATIINARIFHGIALEAERYADECHNMTLERVAQVDKDEDVKYSTRFSGAAC
jgi:hypothetical protein